MFNVKLTSYRERLGRIYHRQTKGHQMISLDGRYRFFVDEPIENPDFWIVQGKGQHQSCQVNIAPENTILLTTEPRSILVYPQNYIDQFGLVCTCQEHTSHPNVHLGPAILPWFVGYDYDKEGKIFYTQDYDSLKVSTPQKTKLISVITSNKAFTQGHIDRIRFVEKLKAHYGDALDVFGQGICDFGDKWDVLAPYKYHIVIENSSQRYYWTEKIGDCYLAETFPFYYGCTNLGDYFPQSAFLPIDIHQPEQAIQLIDKAIAENTYETHREDLNACKMRCLDEYNLFEYAVRLCDTLNPNLPKRSVTIKPCSSASDIHNLWRYMVARKYYVLKKQIGDWLKK